MNDPAKLRARLDGLKGRNHFEVLGLKKGAATAAIKAAYFQLAKTFHPDTVAADAPEEVARLKADIFSLIGEAYRVLGDEKLRAEYLEQLELGSDAGEPIDVTRILAAEQSFQKGCILLKARKFQEAVKMLDEAVELNDKEGEFLAWRAWARFLASKEKSSVKDAALKEIASAINMNPKCAMGYYFAGQIYKLMGDPATALKWFKKALSVDPNHIDAQREVRLASGQK